MYHNKPSAFCSGIVLQFLISYILLQLNYRGILLAQMSICCEI